MAPKQIKRRRQDNAQKFNQLQEKGVEEFGMRWLIVSQAITETASLNGIDVPKNKTALSAIAYKVCKLYQSWETPIEKGG